MLPTCIGIRTNNFTEVSKRLSIKISDFFTSEHIEIIARDTEFVRRASQLSGEKFLDLLMFTRFEGDKTSLNDLACHLESRYGIELSKQGLDKRFNGFAILFLKAFLEKLLQSQFVEAAQIIPVEHFPAIKIKDSTCFQLPGHLAEIYPGSGGAGSKASIRIQFEYDLISGQITDLSLHPFNEQDTANAQQELDKIKEGELVIRDLGYINLTCLEEIGSKNAFYLNRLQPRVTAYEMCNDKLLPIDFNKVRKEMIKENLMCVEKQVYLGEGQKVSTRLIIERMPDARVEERLRKARQEAKKKGRRISDEYVSRSHLNLFITNIEQDILPSKKCNTIYTIRWQIELIFKIWKSVGQIHKVKKMKVERLECTLYAKLLWIAMNWEILMSIYSYLWKTDGAVISLMKAYKTLLNRMENQRNAIYAGEDQLQLFIQKTYSLALKYHVLEKKKNKQSSMDVLSFVATHF
jgi:hypothetical protein